MCSSDLDLVFDSCRDKQGQNKRHHGAKQNIFEYTGSGNIKLIEIVKQFVKHGDIMDVELQK